MSCAAIIALGVVTGLASASSPSTTHVEFNLVRETATRELRANNGRVWTAAFDLTVERDSVEVDVCVDLVRGGGVTAMDVQRMTRGWESAVDDVWSHRFGVVLPSGRVLPISFRLEFQCLDPHHRVLVRDSSPANDVLRWSRRTSPQSVAHEVGHMIGAFDEYRGGGTDPGGEVVNDPVSIMASRPTAGMTRPRHYDLVLQTLRRRWGREDITIVALH